VETDPVGAEETEAGFRKETEGLKRGTFGDLRGEKRRGTSGASKNRYRGPPSTRYATAKKGGPEGDRGPGVDNKGKGDPERTGGDMHSVQASLMVRPNRGEKGGRQTMKKGKEERRPLGISLG